MLPTAALVGLDPPVWQLRREPDRCPTPGWTAEMGWGWGKEQGATRDQDRVPMLGSWASSGKVTELEPGTAGVEPVVGTAQNRLAMQETGTVLALRGGHREGWERRLGATVSTGCHSHSRCGEEGPSVHSR